MNQVLRHLSGRPLILILFALIYSEVTTPASAQSPGTITGTIVDVTGTAVSGAQVTLTVQGIVPNQEAVSGADGVFFFGNVAPGPFHLTFAAPGFAALAVAGTLHSGEDLAMSRNVLQVARLTTNVDVTLTTADIAEEQLAVEERQRLLDVLPNYYVVYDHNPAPLSAKQKFDLAWKSIYDPVNFGIIGVIAGVQQARNDFSGYGQGTEGYAKRYGASFGDFVSGTILSGAILPSLFRQDPRYYYKGTGTRRSRILYALKRSIICQGDNGRPQVNYSSILGDLAAGGISNLYYPNKDRNGVALTFENAALGIAGDAATNLFQEFVSRRLTRKATHGGP
jgi:hypothetical protein